MKKFGRALSSIVLAGLMWAIASTAQSADLSGGWKGTWTKDGDALPVTVRFERRQATYTGSFDSDELQVLQIPFSNIAVTTPRVHFELKGDQSTTIFDGTLVGNRLFGNFVDGGTKGTFQLTREALPQDTVAAKDVTFRDENVTLAGTLLFPGRSVRHSAICSCRGRDPKDAGPIAIWRSVWPRRVLRP